MRTPWLAALAAGTSMVVNAASDKMIPVTERNGAAYVAASDLERAAAIAVKPLPGSDAVVACSETRCGPVKDFLREGGATWIGVTELAKTLGLAARFGEDRRNVRFEAELESAPPPGSIARVGDLAPNFRVTRLDGRPVSMNDWRGKRVLIQSWASW